MTGVIFLNPEHDRNEDVAHKYLPADEYLSGNVREKLRTARAFAETDKGYTVNVQSLEAVQPVDLTASEISVRLGAAWLPTEVVRDFTFDGIEARSALMERNLEQLQQEQEIERKEEEQHELFRRGGRSGRPAEFERR